MTLPPLRGHPPGFPVVTTLRGEPISDDVPISRKFTIVHDLRRPADQPFRWYVRGACTPPGYYSLTEADLFIAREIAKYQNGTIISPFVPTHMILWQPPQAPIIRRRIPVRMIDMSWRRAGVLAAMYKEEDWTACIIPEWFYDKSLGRLVLDEILMGFSWTVRTYEEGLDLETIW